MEFWDPISWTEFGSISASVTKVASEFRDHSVRVELGVSPEFISRIPTEHGLPGKVEIEIERISPARLQFHEDHVFPESFAFNLLMGRRWRPIQKDIREAEVICRELGLGDLIDRM